MRFWGIFSSDHMHLKCAAAWVSHACAAGGAPFPRSVGLGHFSGGELLLMRRPSMPAGGLVGMIGQAPGNQVLIGIDDTSGPQFRIEHTPPFRHHGYLGLVAVGPVGSRDFAHRLLSRLPGHRNRDLLPDCHGELVFRLFMSCVHDLGGPGDKRAAPGVLAGAARAMLDMLPDLVDGPAPPVALCAANGDSLVAAVSGTGMWVCSSDGIRACPRCSEPVRSLQHDPSVVDHPSTRVVAVAHLGDGEAPEGFARIPDRQILTVTAAGEVQSRSV